MSIKLSDILNDERKITIPYKGEKINITYKPSAFCEANRKKVGEYTFLDSYLCFMLNEAIIEWDILDDDGNPVPVTSDIFDVLGDGSIIYIYDTLRADGSTIDPKKGGILSDT